MLIISFAILWHFRTIGYSSFGFSSFWDMNQFFITYQALVTELLRYNRDISCLKPLISTSSPNLSENCLDKILQEIGKRFLPQLNLRWNTVQRSKKRFYQKYDSWSQGIFEVKLKAANSISAESSNYLVGRPRKSFD